MGDGSRRQEREQRAPPRRKGILKAQASLLSRTPSKARVSINLQDNEISLDRSGKLGSPRARKPQSRLTQVVVGGLDASRRRRVEEVLRETGATAPAPLRPAEW